MTIANTLAATLKDLGFARAYGLPGEDHMTLLDALAEAGIDYHPSYNESSAVIMAATDALVGGGCGLAVLSLAPGISNGMNGLLHAYLEQIPVLVISGQHEGAKLPFVVRQGFDLDDIIAPVTRWQVRVTSNADIPAVLAKAVAVACGPTPGPVYVELPDSVAKEAGASASASVSASVRAMLAGRERGSGRVGPSGAADRLRDRLRRARRPALVVCGHGREVSPETAAVFSQELRCPVFLSSAQKGLLGFDSDYYAGTFLNGRLERRILDQCDLVVMVNPSAFDFYNRPLGLPADVVAVTSEWFTEWLLDFDERLLADPEQILRHAAAGAGSGSSQWGPADIVAYREFVRDTLAGDGGDGFSVAEAVRIALDEWPAGGHLIADAGFSKPIVAMLSGPASPGGYLASNALSTMGFAIPAAVAAARAGSASALTFLGDGSLLMRATELMLLRDVRVPMAFVAMMDHSLTQIEVKQELRGLARVGVALPRFSCAALAGALGVNGIDARSAGELAAAVKAARDTEGVTLIGAYVSTAGNRRVFESLRD